ncbi:MAG: tRNA pseudouridine(38-40) synthase TruA, partial [Planctomycetota bacterium]
IYNAAVRSPRRHRFSHFEHRPLDAAAMHEAALHLVGTHDFFSMATLAKLKETTVRTITRAAVSRRDGDPDMIDIEFDGDGFLYNQVRTMAGTLLDVGLGRRTTGSIVPLLAARDRKLAGQNLPACGLTLVAVRY